MSLGIVLLVHDHPDRAARIARHWTGQGCPVALHLDAAVPDAEAARLRAALGSDEYVHLVPRIAVAWGGWSMVKATQEAVAVLLARNPRLRHVHLASGSCLPLRPAADYRDWLADRHDTDLIESVPLGGPAWTKFGMEEERFTLRFPSALRRHRRTFDAFVALQRRLGLRRAPPSGIVPHLGSQWWCLTARTLRAILSDRDRPRLERYFRTTWIPDESYFQTLARRHARCLKAQSPTLSRFDPRGRPYVFYDDHRSLLERSGAFVARKVWHGAQGLHDAFLTARPTSRAAPKPASVDRALAQVERACAAVAV